VNGKLIYSFASEGENKIPMGFGISEEVCTRSRASFPLSCMEIPGKFAGSRQKTLHKMAGCLGARSEPKGSALGYRPASIQTQYDWSMKKKRNYEHTVKAFGSLTCVSTLTHIVGSEFPRCTLPNPPSAMGLGSYLMPLSSWRRGNTRADVMILESKARMRFRPSEMVGRSLRVLSIS
jgi:hypothetical protein